MSVYNRMPQHGEWQGPASGQAARTARSRSQTWFEASTFASQNGQVLENKREMGHFVGPRGVVIAQDLLHGQVKKIPIMLRRHPESKRNSDNLDVTSEIDRSLSRSHTGLF